MPSLTNVTNLAKADVWSVIGRMIRGNGRLAISGNRSALKRLGAHTLGGAVIGGGVSYARGGDVQQGAMRGALAGTAFGFAGGRSAFRAFRRFGMGTGGVTGGVSQAAAPIGASRSALDVPAFQRRGLGGSYKPLTKRQRAAVNARQAQLLEFRRIEQMTGEAGYTTAYQRRTGRPFNLNRAVSNYNRRGR